MQSSEGPSQLPYSHISYSVVHFEQSRRMGQTQKHKTAVDFLSTCDKTYEGYEEFS